MHIEFPAFSIRRGLPMGGKAQRGAILPLATVLLAMISAFLIGVTQLIHESSRENILKEESIHKDMTILFEDAMQLNAMANINLLMAERAEQLLTTLQKLISWGFHLAETTPLWEQTLPIPDKYNLFRKIDVAVAPILDDLERLAQNQNQHRKNLKFVQERSAIRIELLQSLCSLKCIKNHAPLKSSATCGSATNLPRECQLHLSAGATQWPKERSMSLATLLTNETALSPGFMLVDPEHILGKERHSVSPSKTTEKTSHRDARLGVVHPLLCAHPLNSFRVPCVFNPAGGQGTHGIKRNLFSIAFKPHWSVAVEY